MTPGHIILVFLIIMGTCSISLLILCFEISRKKISSDFENSKTAQMGGFMQAELGIRGHRMIRGGKILKKLEMLD